jgi:hypothetical protein
MVRTKAGFALAAVCLAIPLAASSVIKSPWSAAPAPAVIRVPPPTVDPVQERLRADLAAMQAFRPRYPFWRHVFTISDGSIAFGSAADGRLLATFPTKGDWSAQAVWIDPTLAGTLDGQSLARKLDDRRDQVASLIERADGPVLHNSTREMRS